jgi:glc operon protein GlcG
MTHNITRSLAMISSLVIAGIFATFSISVQARPQGGPGGLPTPPKQNMDLATAKKMAAAAEAAATTANAHVAISIVDANGELVYFERMDGAALRPVVTSQGKARAALMFGVPSKEVQDAMVAGKPINATLTAPVAGAWELTIQQGGLPILKDGKVIAAIGCGGSAPANDEKFAQAGIDALSGK